MRLNHRRVALAARRLAAELAKRDFNEHFCDLLPSCVPPPPPPRRRPAECEIRERARVSFAGWPASWLLYSARIRRMRGTLLWRRAGFAEFTGNVRALRHVGKMNGPDARRGFSRDILLGIVISITYLLYWYFVIPRAQRVIRKIMARNHSRVRHVRLYPETRSLSRHKQGRRKEKETSEGRNNRKKHRIPQGIPCNLSKI